MILACVREHDFRKSSRARRWRSHGALSSVRDREHQASRWADYTLLIFGLNGEKMLTSSKFARLDRGEELRICWQALGTVHCKNVAVNPG